MTAFVYLTSNSDGTPICVRTNAITEVYSNDTDSTKAVVSCGIGDGASRHLVKESVHDVLKAITDALKRHSYD